MINTFILNAEDSEPTRDVIRELLMGTGEPYSLEECKDGNEFNERIMNYEQPIDIAILDIHMPDFDIIGAVKMLWDNWKQTYVIVTSVDDDLSTILDLQNKYHIWGYVLKGKPNEDFGATLSQLVYDAHMKVQSKNEYIEKLLSGIQKYGAY